MLNTAQRSSLAIVLRMFEGQLRQADAWLQDGSEDGILYRRVLRLPPEARAALRGQVATALAEIAELAQAFDLEPEEEDLAAAMAAAMSVSWASLCDSRSERLRRFGDVDPALREVLDPRIERLADLALSLASMLRGPCA
jgi:hypothetical protein